MTRRMLLLSLVIFSISSSWAASASPEENYRRAMSLLLGNNMNLTDRETAVNLLRSAADRDFVPAQTALGTAYEKGVLGSQDTYVAIRWYTKAADQGDWIAQLALGRIFFTGDGVPRDFNAAKKWLTMAAASGDSASAMYLGRLFDEGDGAPTNYREAAKWYRMSSERGNSFAQERLARLLFKGLGGVGRDSKEAYMWLLIAADLGNSRAPQSLQNMDSDLGKRDADAVRVQALALRDRIVATVQQTCGSWPAQYDESPVPPPLQSQLPCEKSNIEAANK